VLCPTCRDPLDPRSLRCAGGHGFEKIDGILRLLDPGFGERLDGFLELFQPLREADGRRIADPSVFPGLPQVLSRDPEWRMRGYDAAVIRRLTEDRVCGTALDVGAWNGWLSHLLAVDGHAVTAVDYFVDELDGLGAHRFYSVGWRSIQTDLRDLSILDQRFDLVILNRCIQFFEDPAAMVTSAAERLEAGGLLVATGLEFFADPSGRRQQVEAMLERFRQHGIVPFIPIKGYLDTEDLRRLRAAGLELRAYPQLRMRIARARSWLDPKRGRPCFGVLERGRPQEHGRIGSTETAAAAPAADTGQPSDHSRDS
jgi:SAM-dependent methyltransferase